MVQKLTAEQIYRTCDPAQLGCKTSEEAGPLDTIIGQARAVRALRFGLDIKEKGFNIYVSGQPGTGRTTAIERYLSEFATRRPIPDDWIYVNNFQDGLLPNAIRLPAGRAPEFQRDMQVLVNSAIGDLRAAFESDEYTRHREEIVNTNQRQKQEILSTLNRQAQEVNFVLQPTPMGLLTIPLKRGQPLSDEEFLKLPENEKQDIDKRQQLLKVHLETATRQAQQLDKQLRERLEQLDKQVAEYAIRTHFEEYREKYKELEEVPRYISDIQEDILTNIRSLVSSGDEEAQTPFLRGQPRQDPTRKYGVNVLVTHAAGGGAPVIVENNPTYNNLMGRVEHEAVFGALVTDFSLIRAGSLHRANGGYLVLPVEDLLRNPFTWDALKRALANRKIEIEDVGERIGFSTKSLRPEPLPLDVKVVLIGRHDLYQLLLDYDEQFNELFKVKADFDTVMEWTDAQVKEYTIFVCNLCNFDKLRHLDQSGLARVVEHGARLANDQQKLSTRFGEMADVIREASYYAVLENAPYVSAGHVEKAIDERFYRSSLVRDRLLEQITREIIKIDTSGEKIGQVNGLSVISLGDIRFGQPNRITASLSLGKDGVIDIEREADLSGPIHTKGVLILAGYLADQFAKDRPLSLSARLVFEQNYSGIEGDSASSTELYALLSALSGLPIKQGIAVTGSVNQKGEVQAIGGVNEKIEGYFELCHVRGLTGEQGVLIPSSNQPNLMLKDSLRRAVDAGEFHVWAVDHIEEGIEILTGVKAGKRDSSGKFEAESVFARVDARLQQLAERLEQFGKEDDDENPPGHGEELPPADPEI